MASIKEYAAASGRRYRVRYKRPDGKWTEKRGFLTKRDAAAWAATVEVSKMRGEYIDPALARVTVSELAKLWLAKKEGSLKPSSYKPLETAWRVYVEPQWASVPISEVMPSDVEAWITALSAGRARTERKRTDFDGKPRSASVVLRALGVLAGILDDAVRDRRIHRNPARNADNLPRKVSKKRRRYLSNDEVARLAGATRSFELATLVLVLSYTGIRWGEAVALTVRSIEFLRGRLRIAATATEVEGVVKVGAPKNWEARAVPFPAFLAEPLARLCEDKAPGDLVFPARSGRHLARPDTAVGRSSWWNAALRDAGIEHLTPHDLKHTAASLAVSAGANVKVLQKMLGHKSAAMTLDTYADLFEDDLAQVGAALNAKAIQAGEVKDLLAGDVMSRRARAQDLPKNVRAIG